MANSQRKLNLQRLTRHPEKLKFTTMFFFLLQAIFTISCKGKHKKMNAGSFPQIIFSLAILHIF